MKPVLLLALTLLAGQAAFLSAQNPPDARARARTVRDLAKQGVDAVDKIAPYVSDPDLDVRLEAVKALTTIGGPKTLDSLLKAAHDNDPEIQIRATDGIVDIYLPGYIKTGLSGSLRRAGTAIRSHFTDTNDQIIDAFVQVPPEAIAALGRLVDGGASMDSRANAARAVGILRGHDAIPNLYEALRSKDDRLMYEALIALQKIRDPASAPGMAFVMRDLDERIQVTALETTGLLLNKDAAPDVRDVIDHARTIKVKRAGVGALAMLADPADHPRFITFLSDRDNGVRAAAAEGLARLKNPVDLPLLQGLFNNERNTGARLAEAFALSMIGNLDTGELSPFRYLVNTLDQSSYRGVALAYLIELAREAKARQAVYTLLPSATKEEKIGLATVLGRSGDKDSVPYLETLSMDPNADVAAEGIRDLRTLRARLP